MKRRARGMTLLEILVSITVLAMVAVLMYGAFDSLSRAKKGEAQRIDRAHQGREAMERMVRELQTAYLSAHNPQILSLLTRTTLFVGLRGSPHARVDFAAFSHRRIERDARESDQAELGYFVVRDPVVHGKYDLVRREQTPIDLEPQKGGIVQILAEDIETFELRYLDATTAQWTDNWDSTRTTGQPARIPLAVHIRLVLKGVPNGKPYVFVTKVMLPIQRPLSFGIPR